MCHLLGDTNEMKYIYIYKTFTFTLHYITLYLFTLHLSDTSVSNCREAVVCVWSATVFPVCFQVNKHSVFMASSVHLFIFEVFSAHWNKASSLPAAVHCGYLSFLLLGLWADLVAGMALPSDVTYTEMQSVIEDLQVALNNYSSSLRETVRHVSISSHVGA